LDAEYSSFDLDASNNVINWRSLTGSIVASQATSAARPAYVTNVMNGKPAVRFDGSNDLLTLGGSLAGLIPSAATLVCFVRILDGDYSVFGTINGTNKWNAGSGSGTFGLFTSAAVASFPTDMPFNGTWVMSVRASAAYGLEVRLNSIRTSYLSSITYSAGTTAFLGAGGNGTQGFLSGDIHSFALYNRVLSDKELRTIEECFAWRYDGVYDPDRTSQVLQLEDFATIELEDGSVLNT
jgi:hypothetical protein